MNNYIGLYKDLPEPLPENELNIKLAQMPNSEVRRQIIEHNLRLILPIAKKYAFNKEMFEEFMSIGTVGLIKAIDTYKLEKITKFSTYATTCIENEILYFMRCNINNNKNVSIYEFKDDNDEMTIESSLISKDNVIEEYEKKEIGKIVKEIIDTLSEREKFIIKNYYGFECERMNQEQIAKELNVSRQLISKHFHIALNKIRVKLSKYGIKTPQKEKIKEKNSI